MSAVVSIVAGLLAWTQPPSGTPSQPAAAAADAALRHWEAGRFDEARKSIARAYMIEPWRQYLYARAQIERADDRCGDAIEFYRLYLDEAPPDDAAALAREGIAACERELAANPPPADVPAPANDVAVRPWWRDALGTTFAVTGGVTLLTGTGMFAWVAADRRAASRSDRHDAFARRIRRAERVSVAGVALVSIGAALLTAGVVRLAVVQARQRRGARPRARAAVARWQLDVPSLTLRW